MRARSVHASCIDANVAAAYVAAALTEREREAVDVHVDGCPECRALLSAAARQSGDTDGGLRASSVLPLGTRVGPYVVEAVVDAGGMGVVYAAGDARLGRQVALKALSPDGGRHGAPAQRFSEASTMARVAHPNVVAVYDVVERGGAWYLAMELVRGRNVRQWIAAQPRSVREIVEVFLAAGEGLAAVHDAGLVHRDVKPANLLRGDDGRVRIADFGLATARDQAEVSAHAGTPAYMAPELARGGLADARSDQYAFCASMYEAIHGVLPGEPGARRAAVPRGISNALERGMCRDPAARFASVPELLAALAAGRPAARPLWRVVGASLAVALAVGSCYAYRAAVSRSAMVACEAGDSLQGIWDGERQREVEAALRSTGASYAASAWDRVQRSLGAWATAYTVEHRAACAATWVASTQPEAQLATRLDCLRDRRREARALTEQLVRGDTTTAANAVYASRLADPESCAVSGPGVARATPPNDPLRAVRRAVLREVGARIRALIRTGHPDAAHQLALGVVGDAEQLDETAAHAEALWYLGWTEVELAQVDLAEQHLLAAISLAERAGAARTRAEAWVRMLRLEHLRGRYDRVAVYRAQAEAAIAAAGGDPELRAILLQFAGTMYTARGEFSTAIEVLEQAMVVDPDIPDWARGTVIESLAIAHLNAGDTLKAIELLDQGRSMIEQGLGAEHPRVGYSLENLAIAWFDRLDVERALPVMRRALAILSAGLGSHRSVAIAYDVLGFIELEGGSVAAAEAAHRRASALWESLRISHPRRSLTHFGLAMVAIAAGRYGDAVDGAETAWRIAQQLAEAKDRALITLGLARALCLARRDPIRVRALAREARELYLSQPRSSRDERDLATATQLAASPARCAR